MYKGLTLFEFKQLCNSPNFKDIIIKMKQDFNLEDDEFAFPVFKHFWDSAMKKEIKRIHDEKNKKTVAEQTVKKISNVKKCGSYKPKAIETKYKGYRFRSRLEARWAVFFDALGLDWEYEIEGYKLPDGRYYLPDFLVTTEDGNRWFIEVKGNLEDKDSIQKAQMLDKNPPDYAFGCLIVGNLAFCDVNAAPDEYGSMHFLAISLMKKVSFVRFNRAIEVARSARFEHGE